MLELAGRFKLTCDMVAVDSAMVHDFDAMLIVA